MRIPGVNSLTNIRSGYAAAVPRITTRLELGEALRALRETRGLAQAEVASALGLKSQGSVSQWESGGTAPTVDNLLAVLNLYEAELRVDSREEVELQLLAASLAPDEVKDLTATVEGLLVPERRPVVRSLLGNVAREARKAD